MGNKIPGAQNKTRLALSNGLSCLQPPCLQAASTCCHLCTLAFAPSWPGRSWECCAVCTGAKSPTPTLFHLLPSKTILLLEAPRYLLPTHSLHSHVLCHFAKCSWDYLGTAETQSCSALQHRNPGFINLNLAQWRTAGKLTSKCSLLSAWRQNSAQCIATRVSAEKKPPSEAPKGQAAEKLRLDMQPHLSPSCPFTAGTPGQSSIAWAIRGTSLSAAVHTRISQRHMTEFKAVSVVA